MPATAIAARPSRFATSTTVNHTPPPGGPNPEETMTRYLLDTFAATFAIAVYGYLMAYAVIGMAGWL